VKAEKATTLALGIYGTSDGEQCIVFGSEFQPMAVLQFLMCAGAAQEFRQ
jgi:hypothetical protein